jgi:hypothetical protein
MRLRQKCKTTNKILVFTPSLTVGACNGRGLVNWTFDATINEKCYVKKKSLFGQFEFLRCGSVGNFLVF